VFALSSGLDDATKADMAWGTYALLTQTNAQGAILYRSGGDGVVCARGSVRLPTTGMQGGLGTPEQTPVQVLAALSQSVGGSGAVTMGGEGADGGAEAGAYTRPLFSSTQAVLVNYSFLPLSNRLGENHAPNVSHKMSRRAEK
jgi:hypothetical protein